MPSFAIVVVIVLIVFEERDMKRGVNRKESSKHEKKKVLWKRNRLQSQIRISISKHVPDSIASLTFCKGSGKSMILEKGEKEEQCVQGNASECNPRR
jgi:hypothetical protein